MIGIIGAMEMETAALSAAVTEQKCETISGILYVSGLLDGQAVVIATCGVGKVHAALCAQTMLLRYQPSLLINTGVAGTLTPELGIGDIAVANVLCQHDMDTSPIGDPIGFVSGINRIYFKADSDVSQRLAACAEACGARTVTGCIATGDQFVATPEKKAWIRAAFGAIACEMEGGAIAQVAALNGLPFAVLRAISDSADGDATLDYPTFASQAAARSVSLLRAFLQGLSA